MADAETTVARAATTPAPGDVLLSVRQLSLDLDGRRGLDRALDHVNLQVRRGEMVGLVGESGSGKSLLALAIMGLLRPPAHVVAGQVLFQGQDLRTLPEAQLDRIRGRRIALIPQDASLALNPVLTIGDQLAETIRRHRPGGARETAEHGRATLRRVGLADPDRVQRAYASQLSGGMKQRVAIALALCCDPELLIADDPTSAVDVTIQAQILADLRQLTERLGVATLFISHDLRVISTLCSRVVALYAGQVVEVGATSTLVGQPTHPYTQALVACTPTVTQRINPLPVITGSPAGATQLPGCRFHPRCPRAVDPCPTTAPPLEGTHHLVACWNPIP
jgi:oligopeptide/dipeptide ABC transporter ATP-binding protein